MEKTHNHYILNIDIQKLVSKEDGTCLAVNTLIQRHQEIPLDQVTEIVEFLTEKLQLK